MAKIGWNMSAFLKMEYELITNPVPPYCLSLTAPQSSAGSFALLAWAS